MNQAIFYEERNVTAKGLDPNNKINEDKLKSYIFKEDYNNLNLLNNIKIPLGKEEISLLYPGCGVDVLFPLIYLEKLFPQIKTANLTFVDSENVFGLIKTVLDDIGISFAENKSNNIVSFHWKNTLINLNFVLNKIESHLPNQEPIDIYFEKAFRIMRDNIPNYENNILNKIKPNGILISDSGFTEQNLKTIEVPKILSSYQEMIIGIKEEIKE
ncbi:hypothetical protein HON71_05435 [Candidatus Woesearchaeota archaeon]|mgnify:CR=1 FL=1|nr:hypothetical protein [Candidatus Woesearchaeota archaeon]MBT6774071.1 hypothetical protein [Candidatus Woesearchaeota archaeon]